MAIQRWFKRSHVAATQRAILIDPHSRTIKELEASFSATDDLVGRYVASGEPGGTACKPQLGVLLSRPPTAIAIMVDSEGLFVPNQRYWRLKGLDRPIAGRGLAICYNQRQTVVTLPGYATVASFEARVWWDIPGSVAWTKAVAQLANVTSA